MKECFRVMSLLTVVKHECSYIAFVLSFRVMSLLTVVKPYFSFALSK